MLLKFLLATALSTIGVASTCFAEDSETSSKQLSENKLTIPQSIAKIKNDAVQHVLKVKPEEQEAMIRETFPQALLKLDDLLNECKTIDERKLVYTYKLDVLAALTARKIPEMNERLEHSLQELEKSGEPTLVSLAEEKRFLGDLLNLSALSREQQVELARKYCQFIIKREPQLALTQMLTLDRYWHATNANQEVADTYEELAEHFSQFKGNSFQEAENLLHGTARRIRLPGSEMELAGTTMDGEHFDIKQLHGKVVLVDFWDMYCKPCRAEFPRVKKLYEQYKPDGFEVVGVNLDTEVETLKKVLAHEDLPWTTLNEPTDSKKRGWINPVAKHYGINAVPCMILIGADGKVISITARGEELERLLAEIFTKQS